MQIQEEQQGERLQLRLQGNLDIYTVAELRGRLLSYLSSVHILDLDLHEVAEIDGAGIQFLMAVKSSASRQGCQLSLSAHSPAVITALEVCRLTSFFGDPIYLHKESAR